MGEKNKQGLKWNLKKYINLPTNKTKDNDAILKALSQWGAKVQTYSAPSCSTERECSIFSHKILSYWGSNVFLWRFWRECVILDGKSQACSFIASFQSRNSVVWWAYVSITRAMSRLNPQNEHSPVISLFTTAFHNTKYGTWLLKI